MSPTSLTLMIPRNSPLLSATTASSCFLGNANRHTKSDSESAGCTVWKSRFIAEVMGIWKRRSRCPTRVSRWYSDTDELPTTTWLTATAMRPGTTNDGAPVDSATNMTAASGVRYPAAKKRCHTNEGEESHRFHANVDPAPHNATNNESQYGKWDKHSPYPAAGNHRRRSNRSNRNSIPNIGNVSSGFSTQRST